MAWTIRYTPKAARMFDRLDLKIAERIMRYLEERVAPAPREEGKALSGPLGDFWRYRIGDYRVLVRIEDDELVVLVVKVDHRGRVYRR